MIATFDVETTEDTEQITCAAVYAQGESIVTFHSGDGIPMGEHTIMELLDYLVCLHNDGVAITTWNGTWFDFKLLHKLVKDHPHLQKVVRELTLKHVDYMYFIFCCMGYPVSLDNACRGSKVKSKLDSVTLKDGRVIHPDGSQAPLLWFAGETDAVLKYLREDVRCLMDLVLNWEKSKCAYWLAKSGNLKQLSLIAPDGTEPFLSVEYCNTIPLPDVSWMTNPRTRESISGWLYV